MALFIPRSALDDILEHARGGVPNEVCGLLAGRFEKDGSRRVERHYRVTNAHRRPKGEFLLDPREQMEITLEVEDELGLDVIGFYHSHPLGPPHLSTTDAARATWPGASYFLVWLQPEEGFSSWTWDGEKNRFNAEDVVPV